MLIQDILINSFVTMFSLSLLIISLISYHKHKKPKLALLIFVFIIFSIKSILFSLSLFYTDFSVLTSDSYFRLFDLVILLLLFMAALKR